MVVACRDAEVSYERHMEILLRKVHLDNTKDMGNMGAAVAAVHVVMMLAVVAHLAAAIVHLAAAHRPGSTAAAPQAAALPLQVLLGAEAHLPEVRHEDAALRAEAARHHDVRVHQDVAHLAVVVEEVVEEKKS